MPLLSFISTRLGHSGISKRFRQLADGTFLRHKAGRNHNHAKKDHSTRAGLRRPSTTDATQTRTLQRMLRA